MSPTAPHQPGRVHASQGTWRAEDALRSQDEWQGLPSGWAASLGKLSVHCGPWDPLSPPTSTSLDTINLGTWEPASWDKQTLYYYYYLPEIQRISSVMSSSQGPQGLTVFPGGGREPESSTVRQEGLECPAAERPWEAKGWTPTSGCQQLLEVRTPSGREQLSTGQRSPPRPRPTRSSWAVAVTLPLLARPRPCPASTGFGHGCPQNCLSSTPPRTVPTGNSSSAGVCGWSSVTSQGVSPSCSAPLGRGGRGHPWPEQLLCLSHVACGGAVSLDLTGLGPSQREGVWHVPRSQGPLWWSGQRARKAAVEPCTL